MAEETECGVRPTPSPVSLGSPPSPPRGRGDCQELGWAGSALSWPVTPASSRQWSRQDGGAATKLGQHRWAGHLAESAFPSEEAANGGSNRLMVPVEFEAPVQSPDQIHGVGAFKGFLDEVV